MRPATEQLLKSYSLKYSTFVFPRTETSCDETVCSSSDSRRRDYGTVVCRLGQEDLIVGMNLVMISPNTVTLDTIEPNLKSDISAVIRHVGALIPP